MTDTSEAPEFGYGRGNRPLWTARDRTAEEIRDVLRREGCREFSEHLAGFVVEGGHSGEAFSVTCTDVELGAAGELARYSAALREAGHQVEFDPDGPDAVRAWPG